MQRRDAERFALAWIDAWNRRDVACVLALYADTLSFTSPTALEVTGCATLGEKTALGDYWQQALARIDDLRFVLDRILWDADARELGIVYTRHAGTSSKRVVETFQFGPAGLVIATEVLHGHVPGSVSKQAGVC